MPRIALPKLLASFSVPTYRWVWASTLFVFGNRIANTLAQGWLVLQLTDSAFAVGLAAGVQGLGQFAASIFSGVLLDRLDRRHVAITADAVAAITALSIGGLVLTEQIAIWHVLIAAFVQGTVFAFRWPAMNTIVYTIVGSHRILNASASQMLALTIARVFGAGIVGALINVWGVGSGFMFATVCSIIATACMLMTVGPFVSGAPLEPLGRAARDGIQYARANKPIWLLLILSAIVEMFGYSHLALLSVFARDVLHVGPVGLGLLGSAAGIGALVSTLILGSLGDYSRKGALLVVSTLLSGLFLAGFALSPWYLLSLALIAVAGAMLMTYDVTLQTLLLVLSDETMRGRVQGLFAFTIGSNSLGALLLGSIAAVVSAPFALGLAGGILAATVLKMQPTLKRM